MNGCPLDNDFYYPCEYADIRNYDTCKKCWEDTKQEMKKYLDKLKKEKQ